MDPEEQVLVIERKIVERIGIFNGLMFDVDTYLREIVVQGVPCFMNRSQVEDDPDYKQLVPYVIMSYEGKYLSYVRGKRAGEKRLVEHRSIGIGCHINPSDDMPLFNTDLLTPILLLLIVKWPKKFLWKQATQITSLPFLTTSPMRSGKCILE